VAVFAAFGLLLGRFVWLQFLHHEYYRTKAENNRISVVPIQPNRGLIMDRNGVVLARNFSAYTLEVNPDKIEDLDATVKALSEVVKIEERDLNRFRKLRMEFRAADTLPIKTRLSDEEVARFAANAYRYPGVEIKAR